MKAYPKLLDNSIKSVTDWINFVTRERDNDVNQVNLLSNNQSVPAITTQSVTVNGSAVPVNGMYLSAANTIALSSNSEPIITGSNSSASNTSLAVSVSASSAVDITAQGTATDIDFNIHAQGPTGAIRFYANSELQMIITNSFSNAVNIFGVSSAGSGFYPSLYGMGSDTNVGVNIISKGNAPVNFCTSGTINSDQGTQQVVVTHTPSASNVVSMTGSNGGAPSLSTSGGNLALKSATGLIQFGSSGSFTANSTKAMSLGSTGPSAANATPQEWLTVVDSAGTTRYIPCF